jgi:hypothetical protein
LRLSPTLIYGTTSSTPDYNRAQTRKHTVLGSINIFIRSGPGVDPNFHLLMFDPLVGWRKVWFFLRNDANALLPMFLDSRPVP